ncbi:MAG: glycosyltransferase [Deltaproteobacteria bacterium]|nr:glycosyltransferase [Deltaproteobacteria bacterium]
MKLSVIIPALNEADFLPTTIRMLRENAVSDVRREIIVSDSGSDERHSRISRPAGRKDRRM